LKTQFDSKDSALIWARELVQRSDVLYVDTETTGVRFGFDDVIDIGVVDGDGRVQMDRLVRPLVAIPADSSSVHGLSNRDVQRAARLQDLWPDVTSLLNGKVLVSYNSTFDEQMMRNAASRRGLSPVQPQRWDCAMEAFAAYNGQSSHHRPGYQWINFETAARMLGLESPEHRAVSDALRCLELVQELSRRR
jgi:DNA polymerase-3 subunit epsilon